MASAGEGIEPLLKDISSVAHVYGASENPEAPVPMPDDPSGLELEQTFLLIFILLLLLCFTTGEYVTSRSPFLTEGSYATLVGLVGGLVLLLFNLFSNADYTISLAFPNDVFFDVLLPPIILYQGFSMHKQRFFKNAVVITLFGLVGTILSFSAISLATGLLSVFSTRTCLRLGAIMAATDSVAVLQVLSPERTPVLHSLVFGEGVVNDAASIVLLRSIRSTYRRTEVDEALSSVITNIFFGFLKTFSLSSIIGVAVGLFSAILMRLRSAQRAFREQATRSTSSPGLQDTPSWLRRSVSIESGGLAVLNHMCATHQVAFIMLLAYLAYFIAELLGLSGIMTLFVTGLVMSHYTLHNMDESAKVTTTNVFHAMSLLAEVTIYLFVGMDCLYEGNWSNVNKTQVVALIVVLLVAIAVSRIIFVIPICLLQNLWPADRKLNFYDMAIIVWAGTLRGAVSVALSMYSFAPKDNPEFADRESSTVIASVMALVLFNVVVLNAVTKPVVGYLDAKRKASSNLDGSMGLSLASYPAEGGDWDRGEDGYIPARIGDAGGSGTEASKRGWLVQKWSAFDDEVMKPIFGGEAAHPRRRDTDPLLASHDDSGEEEEITRDVCLKAENSREG